MSRCSPYARITAILVACGAWISSAAGQAPWSIEPTALLYPDLTDLQIQHQEVLIHNPGSQPLSIVQIDVSCEACLTTELSSKRIEPGDVATLSVTFNPAGYRGSVEQSIVILTDDPSHPSIVLPVRATVYPAFDIRGGPVVFDDLVADEVRFWDLYIAPRTSSLEPVTWVRSDYPGIAAELMATDKPGEFRIRIHTVPPQPVEGLVQSQLLLGVAEDPEPKFAMPILLQVVPSLHVQPATLELAALDQEQFRMIFIRQHGDAPCRLVDVEVPNAHFRAEILPDSSLPNYRINIYARGLAGLHGDLGSVALTFFCADGNEEKQIPVVIQPGSSNRMMPGMTSHLRLRQ